MQHKTRARASHTPSVRIVTVDEMRKIAAELERVSQPGTSAFTRLEVLQWAMSYSGAYFRTARGTLRRVFPKGRIEVPLTANEEEQADVAT